MKLQSPVFSDNQYLPKKYTGEDLNINPPLIISEVPRQAKSLALILLDIDALMDDWVHWLLYNIDPATVKIEADSLPKGAIAGLTSFGSTAYSGPCPPTGIHRYIFKLYALDARLDLPPEADKEKLKIAMRGRILEQTQLIGLYKK
ncbi:YbhB/YbcL family Raf kinase inhibitor-like protein [Candidatus Falkowbacteria bacterium]|nr:YbhB/YbcL family Raf kinase inhibitor-like protein [Candidatus Falkowbacteria bacterium]